MDKPEPMEFDVSDVVELRYNRERDQWTATRRGIDVVMPRGTQPSAADVADGLAVVQVEHHPN